MWKRCSVALLTLFSASAWSQAGLTERESRWLAAVTPVVKFAREQLLPVDVMVQPQNAPGEAPLAMVFLNGRCKLVMSLRGNPSADAAISSIPPASFEAVAEAIGAHEVAHCWRHAQGVRRALPAGFIDNRSIALGERPFAQRAHSIDESRQEEGFADLVALAWTKARHPEHYASVHEWFVKTREYQPMPGGHHDTRAWVDLARDPRVFTPHGTPFEQVVGAWQQGMADEAD